MYFRFFGEITINFNIECPLSKCRVCKPNLEKEGKFSCTECIDPLFDPQNDCKCKIGECEKKLSFQDIFMQKKPICDPLTEPKVKDKHCKQCDPFSFKCSQCHKHENRYLKNGSCVCDAFFKEINKQCIQGKKESVLQVSAAVQEQKSTFFGTLMVMVVSNPNMFIGFLESLQFVSFNLYINVDYPKPVRNFLEMFSVFDGGDLPQIIPANKYYMESVSGFKKNDHDALLLRNASQYLLVTLIVGGIYIILKALEKKFLQKDTSEDRKLNYFQKGLIKALENFEYGIFFIGVSGSYLNFTTFSLLQLRSIAIENLTQLMSLLMAYFIYLIELAYPVFVLRISQNIMENNKNIEIFEKDEEELKKYLQIQEQQKKQFGIFYEEFNHNNLVSTGYLGFVAIRKLIFGFFLVFFNSFTKTNLVLLLLNCCLMIFLNLKYKPYKTNFYNYYHSLPELLYIGVYVCSLQLVDTDEISNELRELISKVMIIFFVSILSVEFLLVLAQNLQMIGNIFLFIYKLLKKYIKRPESTQNLLGNELDTKVIFITDTGNQNEGPKDD